MAFPVSPSNGDTFVANGARYTYIAAKNAWIKSATQNIANLVGNSLTVTGNISGGNVTASSATFSGTGAVKITAGTTAQRPASPATGMLRYNSDLTSFEGYNGAAWGAIGGGGGGGYTGSQGYTGSAGYTGSQGVIGYTGSAGTGGGGGSALTAEVISTNTTAVKDKLYILTATLTLTLPASPAAGDIVGVSNLSGTTTAVIARNGKLIMSSGEDLTVDVLNASFRLQYINSTIGWLIT